MEKGQSLSKANKAMLAAEEKESTKGASSTSSSPPKPVEGANGRYDVFLSFNGLDILSEFTDHLYHRLDTAGICVFRNRDNIPIDEEFSPMLLDAITCSKISIPIISRCYVLSKWCLRELIHIMDCKKSESHIVLPIFYKVDPSDVWHLQRSFGETFHSCEHRFDEIDIKNGQQALKDVSNLQGWKSAEFTNGHEGELIERVVKTVQSKLRKAFLLRVPKELYRLDDHVEWLMKLTYHTSKETRVIGIYGPGGIGKTTLVKCFYNRLLNKFDHACFLPDIQETTKCHGIEYLQSRLIFEILQEKIAVSTADLGINIIKSRFTRKKALILLDDIDREDQLDALVGEGYWFARGSIIIVTTRNPYILNRLNIRYEQVGMRLEDSLVLFSRHAFHMDHPPRNFADISRDIIRMMLGNPLIIEVIGSYLYTKTDRRVWNDTLEQLKNQPHKDVENKLKITYDALEDGHKEIFLDIACSFIGKKSEFVMYMWDDCGFYASQVIEELKMRSLIKIEDDGNLGMHDELRNLGRKIICQGQPPMRHSRLWVDEEAFKVLTEKKGAATMETICCDEFFAYPFLDCAPTEHLLTYTYGQFKMSPRLKFLRLRNATASGDLNEFFSQVRWLRWSCIELNSSFWATNLHLPKLVVLQLSYSSITDDWRGWNSIMAAKRLKVLQLEYFDSLRCTLDLSVFTELEILIFKNCKELKQVHPSIGEVKSLIHLDLSGCGSLKELPREMGKLEELKELILDYSGITEIPMSIGSLRKLEKLSACLCKSLREIPNSIWDLWNLQYLYIRGSPIEKLPNVIVRLEKPNLSTFTKLEILNLSLCRQLKQIPPSIGKMKSLIHLDLSRCESLSSLPREVGELEELKELILDSSGITEIPTSISSLRKLEKLSAHHCESLREIPDSIWDLQNLQCLYITNSPIEKLPNAIIRLDKPNLSAFTKLEILNLSFCRQLKQIPPFIGKVRSLIHLNLSHCESLKNLPREVSELEELKELILDSSRISEIPTSIGSLRKLEKLSVINCQLLREIPSSIGDLPYLQHLEISCSMISDLPETIQNLSSLQHLELSGCNNLGSLPKLPLSLKYLGASYQGPTLPELSHLIHLEKLDLQWKSIHLNTSHSIP